MLKFTYQQDAEQQFTRGGGPDEFVTLETHANRLPDILDAVRRFLLACGYYIGGNLVIDGPADPGISDAFIMQQPTDDEELINE